MFTDQDFYLVYDVKIVEARNGRKYQLLTLKSPSRCDSHQFLVNRKLDISELRRWDKVKVRLGIKNKRRGANPIFYIRDIEVVI